MEDFIRLTVEPASPIKKKIGEVVLCFQSSYFGPRQYCLKKLRLYEKSAHHFWPKISKPQSGFREGSLYLANELGRPFHKVLALPLYSSDAAPPPALFIEYFSRDETMESFYSPELWEIFQQTFSRVLMEEHWRTGCDLWRHTFDGLDEPLAIMDSNQKPIRFNTHFQHLYERDPALIQKNFIQDGSDFYEKQSYKVSNDDKDYSIAHFVNVTSHLLLREKMAQNQRMSLLGRLADDVAHNLNNPLTGLASMAQILSKQTKDQAARENFIEIEKTSLRCQRIIQNFIQFSKESGSNMVCDLNEIAHQTLPFLKTLIHKTKLKFHLDSKKALVEAEPCLLQQVVFNLIKNALQAVKEEGEVLIESRVDEDQVYLSVEDNGCGITPEDQARLFAPFFTTKPEGTGLGLRISRQWIENFGGRLSFKSCKGKGSRFTFCLPLFQEDQV